MNNVCQYCGRQFKNDRGVKVHQRKCSVLQRIKNQQAINDLIREQFQIAKQQRSISPTNKSQKAKQGFVHRNGYQRQTATANIHGFYTNGKPRQSLSYDYMMGFLKRVNNYKRHNTIPPKLLITYENGTTKWATVDELIKYEIEYRGRQSEIDNYIIKKVEYGNLKPLAGACDSRIHSNPVDIIQYFGDNVKQHLKIESIKSKNNNCLLASLIKQTGKKIDAQKLRKQLNIPLGVSLTPDHADLISTSIQVSYRIFVLSSEQGLDLLKESTNKYEKSVDLLLLNQHYWVITKMPDDALRFKPQLQIQDQDHDIENIAEQNAVYGQEQEIEYPNDIQYHQVLNDPDIETIKDLVQNSNKHILIFGEAGTGKTWTLKQLNGVTMSATTGAASQLIGGNTVNHHICNKLRGIESILAVDESSMMGAPLFEKLYTLAKNRSIRLVLSGDMIQLPPVKASFFFQSQDFIKFAQDCIRINLTVIKRQFKPEQCKFLNDLRVGKIDQQYFKKLQKNKVNNPDMIIVSKRDQAKALNDKELSKLTGQRFTYKPQIQIVGNPNENDIKSAKRDAEEVTLCNGAKVMLTHNIDVESGLVNGAIGNIVDLNQGCVIVKFKNILKPTRIDYLKLDHTEDKENQITTRHMPLMLCYAVTVHKAQGQTVSSAIVELNDMFERGQVYVALSRVQDLDNLQIKGFGYGISDAFLPNRLAYDFIYHNKMITEHELKFIQDSEKQLKMIRRKTWKDPSEIWNHIYIDFETLLKHENDLAQQVPYYNKIIHHKNGQEIFKDRFFDKRWTNDERCDVGEMTWNYIKTVMIKYANNLQGLKESNDLNRKKIYDSEIKKTPTICAYNGSGFDFNFVLKRFLNDKECSKRFLIKSIYKGTALIYLNVYDRISEEVVLKTHDMFQITGCSLKKALTDFCKDADLNKIIEKIEFQDEILYIMNHYYDNPEILKPGVKSRITKLIFTQNGAQYIDTKKDVELYEEVIKYADNDTDVLPMLYRCMDKLSKHALGTNITSFLTAGSMSWYGFISNLPDEAMENSKYDKNRNQSTVIDSKLYKMEYKEFEFCRPSIKGGRVLPRIHQISSNDRFEETIDQAEPMNHGKYVYLDISGMYASLMRNEKVPYGRSQFCSRMEMNAMMNMINTFKKTPDWRSIFNRITEKFGLFIADVDFEENPWNIEPVIQYKQDGKTIWTNARRTDTLTSTDIALIIASGGKIYSINRALTWQHNGTIMRKWIDKTLELKNEGQRTGNSGLKAFGKLLANSTYGQSLKSDKNETIQFISSVEEAHQFVKECCVQKFFDLDGYDVYIGKKHIDPTQFKTSRCQQIGSFILAYSRAMIFDICEIAIPNRYNKNGIHEMPVYGDTDSLVFREWQANLLIKSGWVKFENGRLTDELGEKSHWFMPKRFVSDVDRADAFKSLPFNETSFEIQQEYIWDNAIEDEKRNPANFFFYYLTDAIFSAPKSYGCKYSDHQGHQKDPKLRFKGISLKSAVEEVIINQETGKKESIVKSHKLTYELIKEAYQNKDKTFIADIPSKPQLIKKFTKKEGVDAFLEIVDSNLRRDNPVSRQFFKTQWGGRFHINENITVPYGWAGLE